MIYLFILLIILSFSLSWIITSIGNNKKTFVLKGALITLMLYMSLCIFFSFESVKGWPSSNVLPDTFALQAFVIEEPNKVHKTPGAIYLWVIPESKTNSCPPGLICVRANSSGTPRAYTTPYTKEKHKQMLSVAEKLQNGEMIIVKKKKKGNQDGGERQGNIQSPDAEEFEFLDMPQFLDELRKD